MPHWVVLWQRSHVADLETERSVFAVLQGDAEVHEVVIERDVRVLNWLALVQERKVIKGDNYSSPAPGWRFDCTAMCDE